MTGFAPVAELKVSGLTGYYREPGIGAPLAASLAPSPTRKASPGICSRPS